MSMTERKYACPFRLVAGSGPHVSKVKVCPTGCSCVPGRCGAGVDFALIQTEHLRFGSATCGMVMPGKMPSLTTALILFLFAWLGTKCSLWSSRVAWRGGWVVGGGARLRVILS